MEPWKLGKKVAEAEIAIQEYAAMGFGLRWCPSRVKERQNPFDSAFDMYSSGPPSSTPSIVAAFGAQTS
ncbi:MAG: hypothetical protein PVI06_03855 [Desulfobacterales bacterium]